MSPTNESKIILVVRPTRLADLVRRFNTIGQARFYIEHLGADFSDYERENAAYTEAVTAARETLVEIGRLQIVGREFLPNFLFGPNDTVVVLGQDGLVANTMKYLSGQPVIGVNPDPRRWDGKLLPFVTQDLARIVPEALAGRRNENAVTMANAQLADGQSLLAVNDLFIGPRSHTSARYVIEIDGKQETQSSSGVIVSTGLGSTGWFKSLMTGAAGVYQAAWNGSAPIIASNGKNRAGGFSWDANYLYYTVREPFPTQTTGASLVFGKIRPDEPLTLTSCMAENGVIFSDGIEDDFLQFNSGVSAKINIAPQRGRLIV